MINRGPKFGPKHFARGWPSHPDGDAYLPADRGACAYQAQTGKSWKAAVGHVTVFLPSSSPAGFWGGNRLTKMRDMRYLWVIMTNFVPIANNPLDCQPDEATLSAGQEMMRSEWTRGKSRSCATMAAALIASALAA
jgi:hypothetical protein